MHNRRGDTWQVRWVGEEHAGDVDAAKETLTK